MVTVTTTWLRLGNVIVFMVKRDQHWTNKQPFAVLKFDILLTRPSTRPPPCVLYNNLTSLFAHNSYDQ